MYDRRFLAFCLLTQELSDVGSWPISRIQRASSQPFEIVRVPINIIIYINICVYIYLECDYSHTIEVLEIF